MVGYSNNLGGGMGGVRRHDIGTVRNGWTLVTKKPGPRKLGNLDKCPNGKGNGVTHGDTWTVLESNSYSIFVDGLTEDTTKRCLYKAFAWAGQIVDIFISRKKRKSNRFGFAFVRFDSRGGAQRAIERMQGAIINGRPVQLNEANYRRHTTSFYGNQRDYHATVKNLSQSWVQVVKEGKQKSTNGIVPQTGNNWKPKAVRNDTTGGSKTVKSEVMKMVSVDACEEKMELIQRCIIGESFRPLNYKLTQQMLKDGWDGPGGIEIAELGAHKYILIFDEKAMVQEAMESKFLLGIFDDLRPWRDPCWGFDRRVWIEIKGIPIHAWSEETVFRIGKLWGNLSWWMTSPRVGDLSVLRGSLFKHVNGILFRNGSN